MTQILQNARAAWSIIGLLAVNSVAGVEPTAPAQLPNASFNNCSNPGRGCTFWIRQARGSCDEQRKRDSNPLFFELDLPGPGEFGQSDMTVCFQDMGTTTDRCKTAHLHVETLAPPRRISGAYDVTLESGRRLQGDLEAIECVPPGAVPAGDSANRSDDGPFIPNAEAGDTLPRRLEFREPKYPEELRRMRLESTMVFQTVIHRSGAVDSFTLLACKVHEAGKTSEKELEQYCPVFASAAEKALSTWRYEPALRSGKPIDVYYTVKLEFRFRD